MATSIDFLTFKYHIIVLFLILVLHFTPQKQYRKSVVVCHKVPHKSVVICQKVAHKSVVICQKVAHKSVAVCQKVPHKNVNCFAISLFFSIFAANT